MILPLVIPVGILAICISAFFVLKKAFAVYFENLEDRSSLLQRVLYLVMTKDIVSFFASPEANKIVDILFDEDRDPTEDIEDQLLASVQSAGPEIEKLYSSLKNAYEPSAFVNRAKSAGLLLRLNILLYGIAVSSSQIVALYYLYTGYYHAVTFLNGLIFGGAIIFAVALTSMAIYIYVETRKIDKHVKTLGEPAYSDFPV